MIRATLIAGLLLSTAPAAQELRADSADRAVMYLFDSSLPGSELDAEWLELALADLGVAALPALVSALEDGSYQRDSLFHGVTTQRLTREQRKAALHSVVRMPRRAVRTFLEQTLMVGSTSGERQIALEIAGAMGTAQELLLVASLASPPAGTENVDLAIQRAAQQAFGQIFERDRKAILEARDLFGRVHAYVRAPLVRSVPKAEMADAMAALGRMLGHFDEVDGLVLLELDKLSRRPGATADELLFDSVRPFLDSTDTQLVQLAVPVVANLRDAGAVAQLVQLLGQSEDGLNQRVHLALRQITGLTLKNDTRVWETWLRGEEDWLRNDAHEAFQALTDSDPGRVAWGLLEVGKHRLHHEVLTDHLLPVLARPEPELVGMAAATLGRLQSHQAVPYLLDRLSSHDQIVREACGAALCLITGKELPSDPAAWVGVGH